MKSYRTTSTLNSMHSVDDAIESFTSESYEIANRKNIPSILLNEKISDSSLNECKRVALPSVLLMKKKDEISNRTFNETKRAAFPSVLVTPNKDALEWKEKELKISHKNKIKTEVVKKKKKRRKKIKKVLTKQTSLDNSSKCIKKDEENRPLVSKVQKQKKRRNKHRKNLKYEISGDKLEEFSTQSPIDKSAQSFTSTILNSRRSKVLEPFMLSFDEDTDRQQLMDDFNFYAKRNNLSTRVKLETEADRKNKNKRNKSSSWISCFPFSFCLSKKNTVAQL